ncbi:PilC/PilY family type IV pilus protein [Luteimonas sp. YGD11-2]|uniref:PilC/PilY family type IV pilus protein n=1 Tax=Luteimonas sp. YGD11-2 TaxID=2508168 RepID=UPI00100B10B8
MMRLPAKTLAVAGLMAALGGGGWLMHSVFGAQARPGAALAQAPMNTQVQIPPSFIMALDDSGSMNWETLNNTRDGTFTWARETSGGQRRFYRANGTAFGYGEGLNNTTNFLMVFAYPGRNNQQNRIPPVPNFGFARSHEFNPAYFNPAVNYVPWKRADGSDYLVVDPTNAPVDPRPAGSNNKLNHTIDLTQDLERDDGDWRFTVRQDMLIPAGTRFSGGNDCGNLHRGGGWNTHTQDITASQNCLVGFSYFPATYYLTSSTSPGYTATPLQIVNPVGGPPNTTLYRYEIRPENYASPAQYDAAIQNFANWFTFYRTRREALISGLTNSLVAVNNMSVGWFRINDRSNVTMRDMSNLTQRQALFNDIYALRASGSTPNRRAVRHLGEQFKRTGSNAPVQLSCQRNAGMLFTDGYINEEGNSPTDYDNADGGMGPPFADNFSNTMADIVVPYYSQSLRPDIEANAVPVPAACAGPSPDPRLDCQRNLHMNFYGITLGTLGRMYGVTYLPDPEMPWVVSPDPFTVHPGWVAPQDMHPNAVDEMWHATLNSRGEMINATTPAAITAAMRRILLTVAAGSSPSGTLALTGARVGTGSLSVTPEYEALNEGTDWSGKLSATRLSMSTGSNAIVQQFAWEASTRFPGHAIRSSQTYFGRGATVHQFNAGNLNLSDLCTKSNELYPGMSRCSDTELTALGADAGSAVRYLMGDVTLEEQNGGFLRDRTTLLGDIVNSNPVVSSPRDDYGYRSLGGAIGTSYASYLQNKSSRGYMVYVGANDGMLHAFNGGMSADGTVTSNGGRQEFAYIPTTALGHMGNLLFPYNPANGADQKFDHRYYVDGPVTVSDICGTSCNASSDWRTALVATSGAGGRSVFALDVSSPGSFGASSRLWEISDLNTSLPQTVRDNIGFVLGRPVVVPVKIGTNVRWYAIFGNGYNSKNGRAVLFIADLSGTSPVRMIEAVESGAPPGVNGLGNIVVLDRKGASPGDWVRDGFADTVYAADQKGAIWKFDLLDTTNSTLTTPVFTTREHTEGGVVYRQPITGGMTAATGPGGGVMLYFGTGSFSFNGDPTDTSMQSLYAVNDPVNGPATSTLTRSHLVGQTVASDRSLDVVATPLASRGWYVDLPTGERFVGNPRIASGVVFMPTYVPNAGGTGCATAGLNWLFGLNARSGAAGLSAARWGAPDGASPPEGTASVSLNTRGTAPVKDVGVNVLPRLSPPVPDPTAPGLPPNPPAAGCWMTVTVAGLVDPLYLPYPCGRQSWRQIQ